MQQNCLGAVSTTSQHADSNNTTTSFPVVHDDLNKVQSDKADVESQIAGYIFMCNAATKPECFIYRVFGLPASRIKDVENITPYTKLFLFDLDVKLLYGLYVATSNGKLALEAHAFGGRFPAQVKFSIARECLPLPEAVFKDVIKENYYRKNKFKQELNVEQVTKLVSLFRPISLLSLHGLSPAFLDDPRIAYQKYAVPSQQVTRYTYIDHERRILEFPQTPMPQCTMSPVLPAVAPSYSKLSSALQASQWVAIAAESLNADVQTSNFSRSSSTVPGVSYAHPSFNGSNSRGLGYGYQDQAFQGSHKGLQVATDQGFNDMNIHAYEMQQHPVSSYYTQNQGDSVIPQTYVHQEQMVSADNANTYYNKHPASISRSYNHTQIYPSLHQLQPSVSSEVNARNTYVHYNSANPGTSAYAFENQAHYSVPQTADGATAQQANIVPAHWS